MSRRSHTRKRLRSRTSLLSIIRLTGRTPNGHTVAAAAKRDRTARAILNVGHDRVTIKGGTVDGLGAYDVRLAGVQRDHVVDMKMTGNLA